MKSKYHLEIQVESALTQTDMKESFDQMFVDLPINYQINPTDKNGDHITATFQGADFYSAKFSPHSFHEAFWRHIIQKAKKRLQMGEISSLTKKACIDASKNMMASLMGINPITRGASDYIHISNLQIKNFILVSLSRHVCELLYDLGKFVGRYGGLIGFIDEPLQKAKPETVWEHFRMAMQSLADFYTRTSEIGLNIAKKGILSEKGKSKVVLKLFELPNAIGIPDIGMPICYWDAGLLAGMGETLVGTPVSVEEVNCWGLGDPFCGFQLSLDESSPPFKMSSPQTPHSLTFPNRKVLNSLIRSEYLSISEGRKIRNGISDYVHISLFQLFYSTLAAIEDFGPFLLTAAGKIHGRGLAALQKEPRALSHKKAFEAAQKLASEQKLLSDGNYDRIEFQKDSIILYNHITQLEDDIYNPQYLYFYEAGFFSGLLSELTNTNLWLNMNVNEKGGGYCELS